MRFVLILALGALSLAACAPDPTPTPAPTATPTPTPTPVPSLSVAAAIAKALDVAPFGDAEPARPPVAQEMTEADFGTLLGIAARDPEHEVWVVQIQGSPVDAGIERRGEIKNSIFAYHLLDAISGEKVQTFFSLDDLMPTDVTDLTPVATPTQ